VSAALMPPAAVWRAWLRPLPLVLWGVCLAGIAGVMIVRQTSSDPDARGPQGPVLEALMVVMMSAGAGVVLGAVWKEHLCRPASRLAPDWRRWHGIVLITLLAIQISGVGLALWRVGDDPVAAVALVAVPALIGAALPSNPSWAIGLAALSIVAGGLLIRARPADAGHLIIDALLGRRPGFTASALAIGAGLAAIGLARGADLDEDDITYHVGLSFGGLREAPPDAVRNGWPMRAIRWVDTWTRPRGSSRPLRSGTAAWAWHRRQVFIQAAWPMPLLFDLVIVLAFALLLTLDGALRLGSAMTVVAITAPLGQLLIPAFAGGRAAEALRPSSRGLDVATMALGLAVAQLRAATLNAVATGLLIAVSGRHARWSALAGCMALAIAATPAMNAATLLASSIRAAGRRTAAIGGVIAGGIAPAIFLQFGETVPGWTYGVALAAGALLVPLAWHRLIRIDID
jgi:hypothetical protein